MGIPLTLIKTLTQQSWRKRLATLVIGGLLSFCLWGCANRSQSVRLVELPDIPTGTEVRRLSGSVSEVASPAVFLDLAVLSDQYQPEITIKMPKANQVIDTDKIEVKLKLKGLSIYKDDSLGLGPHLQIILDQRPARSVYDLEDVVMLENLAPGSHTLQVVAVNPWGESFKNETAYARTTFHVFANTGENTPDPDQPLLTYLEPQGTYGAEPVLLDFYLNNAPLHQIAQESTSDDIIDWQIRCTINGQSFVFDQWQPIYLKGLKPGKNWVQLALIDRQGNSIENVFNNTVHTLIYDPNQRDNLSKIVRGELPLEKIGQIVDASYEPPAIEIEAENESVDSTEATDTEETDTEETDTPELTEDAGDKDTDSEKADIIERSEIESTAEPAFEPNNTDKGRTLEEEEEEEEKAIDQAPKPQPGTEKTEDEKTENPDRKVLDAGELQSSQGDAESNESDPTEPLDAETIKPSVTETVEPSEIEVDQSSLRNQVNKATDTPSETDGNPFSRWIDKTKNLFQKSAASTPLDKPSKPLLIEELPVIVEEQAGPDLPETKQNTKVETEIEPETEATNSQENLEILVDDLLEPEDEPGDEAEDETLIERRIEIEGVEIEGTETEETETEEADLFETFIVPETLNAPARESENVMAPLAP